MKLSIVTTLYQSSSYLDEFHRRVGGVARSLVGEDFEILFVNDGSPDDSLELAVEISRKDNHVVVIDLSRNFGHHKAMMAGLTHASGEQVFLIDSDLEEDPEWLRSFSEQLIDEKCDVVYGIQEVRKGSAFERLSGEFYYWFLGWMLNMQHPKNITTARLMTRRYVEALLLHRESEIVISGLWLITGFEQRDQVVCKKSSSSSTYSLRKKISHSINAITSFSSKPLMLIFATGMTIFLISFIYLLSLVVNRLFFSTPLDGWTSIMASVWLLGGITISFIGIIGIYLSKIFAETKQRPNFIIKDIYGRKSDE
ncbi:MAG: glycosyltransferase family 2 protein [Gammaproteobacteria bacterium]|nr:glycosyltransferase family 2 protein [Gammaproteobacteria bacterium]